MKSLALSALALACLATAVPSSGPPATMRAVQKTGIRGCQAPEFSCVSVINDTKTPSPGLGEVLIKVSSTGVNPDELSILGIPALHYTLGIDVAGVVVAVGPGTSQRIKIGDSVWTTGTRGGMAEYAIRLEAIQPAPDSDINAYPATTNPRPSAVSFQPRWTSSLLERCRQWP